MTIFVLIVVMFLSGGDVVTHSAAVPGATLEDCRVAGTTVIQKLQDQKVTVEGADATALVLDAQFACVALTQQTHA